MLQYSDLNNDEKRIIREKLGIERLHPYYLEDNNYLLMDVNELFDYIFLLDLKKLKDAINIINKFKEETIKESDVNKTIKEFLIENENNVIKINSRVYLYKEN